ncbi:hypothetical protein HK104_003861 [Borealophlyctis nickersoniae]|nr:hypothetical protein HK104_003861 [Borealophlyctis nickersoniae]
MSRNNFTLHTCETNQVIAELKDLHMSERKAATALKGYLKPKIIRMNDDLAGRLDKLDFGNTVDKTILKEFVQNSDTFQWLKERFPQIAESMQRGLDKILVKFEWEEEMEQTIEKENDTAPQHSDPTVPNTGSCSVPTIQKRSNPTVANEKSNKKAKNEL